jgi:3-methyladenine DNA glycosylase Tag
LAASKIKRLQKRVEMLMSSHMNNGSKVINEINIANPNSFRENLTEVEKSLLDLLVSNTAKNEMTTVSQMNQVLGIYNKDTKIQNNIRSNTIQLINRKFTIYSGLSDDLIEKQRTEFDKRFFEYQIQRKYLSKVKNQK